MRFSRAFGLVLAMTLLFAVSAQAKVVELTKYDGAYPGGSFDGTGSVGAPAPFPFGLHDIGVDRETGQLYAGNSNPSRVYKFSPAGVAEAFSALAPETTLPVPINNFGDVFVDNSPTSTQGRIYAFPENGPIRAFEPDGTAAPGFPTGVSGACGGDVAPDGSVWIAIWNQAKVIQLSSATGSPTGVQFQTPRPCDLAIDSQGNFYAVEEGGSIVRKYDPTGTLIGAFDSDTSAGEPELAIDLSNDHVYVDHRSYIYEFEPNGALVSKFGEAEDTYPGLQGSRGIGVRASNHTVYAMNENNGTPRIDRFVPTGPITIPDVSAEPAADVGATSATLHGVVNPDGIDTTDCEFRYGIDANYNLTAPCEVAGVPTSVFSGSSDVAVSAPVTGLAKGSTYHYKLTAKNANGVLSQSNDVAFTASDAPGVGNEFASAINTDSAQLNADVDPAGGATSYHFEWGMAPGDYDHTVPIPDGQLGTNAETQRVGVVAHGLAPGTTYHYRVVAHNDAGTATGGDNEFTTFATPAPDTSCPNALQRQQTSAAFLRDCRAYELVSAEDTGGYNVESDLVPGQTPFGGYPRAGERVLYGIHNGAIPGPWNPTNHGVDPYVASRTESGWKTIYEGIPADLSGTTGGPFASPLAGADDRLSTFAFAGNGICDPCFGDGSVNVPLRMPDGHLIKGMAGSTGTSGNPAGTVRKRFSPDGAHFLFGSTAAFEAGANTNGTDATLYERDLDSDTTQVISTLPNGSTIANGDGVAALDISQDGSRIVIGRLISTDAEGNEYYHLYMHVGTSASIDLTPGAGSGALYDGMTADGSAVYFTTRDPLTTAADQDTDDSADIYRADVGTGSATLIRVSAKPGAGAGGPGDTDSCSTPGTSKNIHWNTIDATADCSAAAIAGGGGVASESGEIYFLSPELLDDSGPGHSPVQDAPNLYRAVPGQAPEFVATLESDLDKSTPEPKLHTESGSFGSFNNATGLGFAPNGDILVYDIGDGKILRYSPGGALLGTFAEVSVYETEEFKGEIPSSLGVDRTTGDVFASDSYYVYRYDSSGNQVGYLGSGGAVGVNQQNHNVYIGGNYPQVPTIAVVSPDGSGSGESFPGVFYVRGIATDSLGRTYVAAFSQTALYDQKGRFIRTVALGKSYGVAVDPANDDVYVDQGNQVLHFDSAGNVAGIVDVGPLTSGRSIEVGDDHRLYLVEGGVGGEVHYYDQGRAPDLRSDSPLVEHAVNDSGARHTEDLQVTPDGTYAAFSSTLRLTGFNNLRRSEIYRYDSTAGEIECASCPQTNGAPTTDTKLAPDGLNLADDGRVFFTSSEPLALRDTNGHRDAYEWDQGQVELISLGLSPYDSTLLSASADGADAYFFTRDTLVQQDRNRTLVKLYDAREDGGFAYVAPPVTCKASDECHGPGSDPPASLSIPTISGSSGNHAKAPKGCPRGKVRRAGRCVKKKGRKKSHRRARSARGQRGNR